MDPAFYALLKCPSCQSSGLRAGNGRSARCDTCEEDYAAVDGIYDLLPEDGHTFGVSRDQRFMESELVARVYDRMWRPAFVRVFGGRRAGTAGGGLNGELFIHKHCLGLDDRRGPWLDLSCGSGAFTRGIAAASPSDVVIGLDISKPMLDVARPRVEGYGNVALVRADAHELPFVDGSLGGVNHPGALHVYDDPYRVFLEVFRVLRQDGIYVGSTFAEAESFVGRMTSSIAGIRRFNPHELRGQLARIGFADYEEVRFGGSFIFRARKT